MPDRAGRAAQRGFVGIVGGGPAGLILAIELGRRNVPCVLFEEDLEPPWFPKANSSTARTMEHYRRLGFVEEIREVGLPADYPQDIAYFTRYTGGWELTRLKGLSRREALSSAARRDPAWPTPEPVHRSNQFFIEPVLRRQAARWPSVDLRFGWRAGSVAAGAQGVSLDAEEIASGRSEAFVFDYLCGCDGPRSLVRDALGLRYEGITNEERFFMGGQMLATRLSAPAFYDTVEGGLAWQYWAVNAERRSVISALDGKGELTFHTQLPRGTSGSADWVAESLRLTVRKAFSYQILAMAEWTAGFTLVAERMTLGRAALVGDAAHLFTPTGGLGYNTAVEDAVNLGWKLAAIAQGWGGPGLLPSYEEERRPVALRNTRFSRALADSLGLTPVTLEHEARSPAGDRLRAALEARLAQHAYDEFHTPGIQLGVRYDASSIIAHDGAAVPADEPHCYVPACFPGARAPHLWLDAERCLFDLLGVDFTLVAFDPAADLSPLAAAARRRGVPLKLLAAPGAPARDLYSCDFVLIRPDQHIAWRGNSLPADPEALFRKVAGW